METETKAAFARRLKLSGARISQMVKEGLPCTEDGQVKVREAMAWVRRTIAPQNGSNPAGAGDLGDAKLRLTIAMAEKAELDLAERRGELVPLALAKRAMGTMCRAHRDATLAFAARRGAELAGNWGVDPRVVVADLDAALRSMLVELAEEPVPFEEDAA